MLAALAGVPRTVLIARDIRPTTMGDPQGSVLQASKRRGKAIYRADKVIKEA